MKSLDPESDEEDQEAEENLETLKAHLKECQRLGKYVEAQMTQNRITELKERLVTTKIDKLKTSQAKEMKIYQDTHEKEHANLTDTWQKKLADFEARSQDDEAALLAISNRRSWTTVGLRPKARSPRSLTPHRRSSRSRSARRCWQNKACSADLS